MKKLLYKKEEKASLIWQFLPGNNIITLARERHLSPLGIIGRKKDIIRDAYISLVVYLHEINQYIFTRKER